MTGLFDYGAPAELYFVLRRKSAGLARWRGVSYRRFPSAASAIRFVVEDLSLEALTSAIMEVEQGRFEKETIRTLYQAGAYPLKRA
jgi:hypothetical protein